MSVILNITASEASFSSAYTGKLIALLDGLLSEHEMGDGEVGLIITDDAEIQKLNKKYRDIDAPTDVLSFSYIESGDRDCANEGDVSVGDIYISLDRARQQAFEAGHTIERETAILAVHGVLHLLGYDHDSAAAEKLMWGKQEEILRKIG